MKNQLKGTIFIPDISGYSKFVSEIAAEAGAQIISKLLQALIDANKLPFAISEVEGDAILFYKFGAAYPVSTILAQFKKMLAAFNRVIDQLKADYPEVASLSVKLIVHYGAIGTFSVQGFCKLYGKALIEAHRLLKNKIGSHTYALITDEYIQAVQESASNLQSAGRQCERLNDAEKVCYTFYSYIQSADHSCGCG